MLYNNTTKLEKQLMFKDLESELMSFIPLHTEITNIKDIAGGNSCRVFRKAESLANMYNTSPKDWIKRVGKIESDKYIFDIHWEECTLGIKTGWKIKNKKLRR